MRAQVKRWGNSAAVRIPAQVLGAARLREDQLVDVRAEGGRVIVEPVTLDAAFAAALSGTLGEWLSPEDEAAWADL